MPFVEIQPEKYRRILFDRPRRRTVEINIEANRAVDVYVVPESNFEAWRRGSSDYGGDGFLRTKNLRVRLNKDRQFEDDWYLVLENRSDSPATVHYEVYEL